MENYLNSKVKRRVEVKRIGPEVEARWDRQDCPNEIALNKLTGKDSSGDPMPSSSETGAAAAKGKSRGPTTMEMHKENRD